MASTNSNQHGATSEEMWDLVVLLNRELRSTRLKLESSLSDVKRLQGENEELTTTRDRENAESAQQMNCVAGSCKSADEVNTLKQAKKELESALVKSQTTCTKQEVSRLNDDSSSQIRQPASAHASTDNPPFIPAELLPVLKRFPPPDISDRPKTSKPCARYQPNGDPEIFLDIDIATKT
ncbi:hypothetical protein NLI96_g6557 [Meripilus lineatus]|uniref:Uncharacterized protein n=1 Tax=Meripilus lineatus TaxID=2056292 RepID=A0AAD5YFT5_9APHY|nr:hypothetical protein NLI96_g6557 [Physisporinus lineatus]